MSKSIDKGSRFRVMTGKHVGLTGRIADGPDDRGRFLLTADTTAAEGRSGLLVTADDLASVRFQRLDDAPPEPDPLFVEIEAEIRRLDILLGEGGENALDMIALVAHEMARSEAAETDKERAVSIRAALLACAVFAFSGIRNIDRGAS